MHTKTLLLAGAAFALLAFGIHDKTVAAPPYNVLKAYDWKSLRGDDNPLDEGMIDIIEDSTAIYLQVENVAANKKSFTGKLTFYEYDDGEYVKKTDGTIQFQAKSNQSNGRRRYYKIKTLVEDEVVDIGWLTLMKNKRRKKPLETSRPRMVIRFLKVPEEEDDTPCDEPPDDDIMEEEDPVEDPPEEIEDPDEE